MKKYFRLIKKFFLSMLLLVLAGLFFYVGSIERNMELADNLSSIPDYDYIADIESLMAMQRWGEAQTLCEDVLNSGLSDAEKVSGLLAECRTESQKLQNRLYKAARAFITGSPDNSVEELSGSIAADMIFYGDIRDLAVQGYFKITGREADPLVAALAAAGLITEFADMADWAPAALKAFRKLGMVNDRLSRKLLVVLDEVIKTRKITPQCRRFFIDVKVMLSKCGLIRTGNLMRYVDDPGDLSLLADCAAQAPGLTHLVSKHAAENTVTLIRQVNKNSYSRGVMKQIARKGIRSIKYLVRSGKILHKGSLQDLLLKLGKNYFYWVGIFFTIAGVFLLLRPVLARSKATSSQQLFPDSVAPEKSPEKAGRH